MKAPGHATSANPGLLSLSRGKVAASPEREEIARRYGFASYGELRDLSTPLAIIYGDAAQAYVARSHKGHWFVWEESSEPPGDGKPKVFSGPNSQNGHHQASGARARSDGGWRMMGLPDPSGAMPMPA